MLSGTPDVRNGCIIWNSFNFNNRLKCRFQHFRRDPHYQVNSYPEHVGEGVDLGCEGGGDGERGAVQDAYHRVQLFAANVGKDDGVLECFMKAS